MIMAVVSLGSMALLVVADQLLKLLATNTLAPDRIVTVIPGLLDFRYVRNFGAALGMMEGKAWFFIVMTILIAAVFIFGLFWYKKHNWLSYAASILIVAGGVGNLVDRIFNPGRFVTDYIHFSFFPPVFNFADILVTLGTVALVAYAVTFRGKSGSKHPKKENAE